MRESKREKREGERERERDRVRERELLSQIFFCISANPSRPKTLYLYVLW